MTTLSHTNPNTPGPDNPAPARPDFAVGELAGKVMRQCHEVTALKEKFFAANSEKIVACCHEMVRRFDAGGRLFAMGNGGSSCDAIHLSVEFMHPILEKRPPLPAIALTTDMAILTAIGNDQDFSMIYTQQLKMLGKPGDMLIGVSTSGKSANINRAMKEAKERGMLTIGFTGRDGGRMPGVCDYCFIVPSFSIPRIQETHETLLHVIWDLVHVIRGEEDVI
ncbi:MAG TPA: SIS domain-containing protein [Tepidisphaeraceae bacterium]|jgi:D-sedoheptulose 7-phosphate isomerase|nr:SIS domain-containing protein [Tepidisphaeraceae bacterium]